MIVKIEDLEVGDHILIGAGSKLKTLIVVKKPIKKGVYKWSGRDRWSSVRCTTKCEIKPTTQKRYISGKGYVDVVVDAKQYVHSFDDHNIRINVNLDYKDIWLIKRNGENV